MSADRSGGSSPRSREAPLLSVGLPVYNGLPYLETALTSLLDQDVEDMEVVVCDNASTDGTGELVESMAEEDDRVRYVRNSSNIGGTRNFNRAFELARGKYFRWSSADDFVSPGALERCLQVLEEDASVILAYPQTVLVDEEGEKVREYDDGPGWEAATPEERFEYSLTNWGLANVHYGVVRSRVLAETSLLGHYPGSDLVLLAELATRGRFRKVEGEHLYRRVHPEATAAREPASLAQFFDPGRSASFQDQFLRMFKHLAAVVWKAPVGVRGKVSMFAALARHAIWARRRLAAELTGKVASRADDSEPESDVKVGT